MVISTLHRPLSLTLATLGLISLVACGGGGGSSGGGGNNSSNSSNSVSSASPVVVDDTTPNEINFAATEGAEPNALITSQTVTISGINAATPISISGGEYSIVGGAFTSTAGTITNGQTLAVRLTASDKTNTQKAVTVTVGGVSATFSVTTFADTTADAFSFTAVTGAELNKEYTSEAVTINGIDVAVPVSITGGLYSINGGEFTSAAGTVAAGQTITLKATSSSKTDTTQTAVLSVGSISGTFAVTTIPDTTPPVAEFKFPTPYTMSEANSVKVRGTATDDHAITSMKVVVRSYNFDAPTVTLSTETIDVTPKAAGDYSSWTANIPLTALAENEVKVIATDDRENETLLADANKVVIRQANVASAFPDEVNQFANATVSALDTERNRILVADWQKVMAVDIATGQRTVFIEHDSLCSGYLRGFTIDHKSSRLYGLCEGYKLLEFNLLDAAFIEDNILPEGIAYGVSLDLENGRNRLVLVEQVYEFDGGGGRVWAFSLDSKEFAVISEGNELPLIKGSFGGIAVNGDNYWVTSGGQHDDAALHKIISVNAITGKHEVFADNSTGGGELFNALLADGNTAALLGIVKDTKRNRLIVMEGNANKLLSIDLTTGERSLFKDVSYSGTMGKMVSSQDLDLDDQKEFLLLTDDMRKALILVDLETGEKVILTKSKNDFQ